MSDASTAPSKTKPASLGEMLFGHAVLLVFCVGLPVMFTAVAPLTVTHFTRDQGAVRAMVSKRALFILPYSRTSIEDVFSVDDHFVAGTTNRSRSSSGGSTSVQSEDSAYLTIQGESGTARVEVSPVNIRGVRDRTKEFLVNDSEAHLRLITIANWKFGVFAGGFLSLLTILYVYIVIGGLVRWVAKVAGGSKVSSAPD